MASGQRKQNESFKKYRNRLQAEDAAFKRSQQGRVLWDSSRYGTYVRKQHGKLV